MKDYSELCDEIERFKSFKAAYSEWMDKTQWVQDSVHWSELGRHRADVILERMNRLAAENESLRADKQRLDWLDSQYTHVIDGEGPEQDLVAYRWSVEDACGTVREAIDFAMNRSPENH